MLKNLRVGWPSLSHGGGLQGAAPQLPYGGPFSQALGAAGLSHYAAQLLYKCASDPITQETFGRPNLSPAAIAGVHLAPGAGGAGGAGGSAAAGGGGNQRIISYSSEPTSGSTSGLAKFPTEPYIRPRNVAPQYSAFELPPGEFHDVSWVRSAAAASQTLQTCTCQKIRFRVITAPPLRDNLGNFLGSSRLLTVNCGMKSACSWLHCPDMKRMRMVLCSSIFAGQACFLWHNCSLIPTGLLLCAQQRACRCTAAYLLHGDSQFLWGLCCSRGHLRRRAQNRIRSS